MTALAEAVTPLDNLPEQHYGAILVDPPWAFRTLSGAYRTPTQKKAFHQADDHYKTMSLDALKALPVEQLAAKNCALFMWVVGSHLDAALDLGRTWGFELKTDAFLWVKERLWDAGQLDMLTGDVSPPGIGMGRSINEIRGGGMTLAIIESPYAGDIEANVAYARAAMRDSLDRGEYPIASHLLYTQPGILRDEVPEERQLGIDAGLAWRKVADKAVFYVDRGWSAGMLAAEEIYEREGFPFEVRTLTCTQPEGWAPK